MIEVLHFPSRIPPPSPVLKTHWNVLLRFLPDPFQFIIQSCHSVWLPQLMKCSNTPLDRLLNRFSIWKVILFAPTFRHVLQFTLLNLMSSEFQAYRPKVHINMYLRHVVITTQAADGWSYILPNPSLLAVTVISPYHPSVVEWKDKNTTSIIQWEEPTEKLVNDQAVLSPGTYDRSGHVVRLASVLALLYIQPPPPPPSHPFTHSLTHSLTHTTDECL